MLKQRIITALILAPLVIAGVFFLPLEGFVFFSAAIMLLGAWEFAPLAGFTHPAVRVVFMVFIGGLIGTVQSNVELNAIWVDGTLAFPYFMAIEVAAVWWFLSIFLIYSFPKSAHVWAGSFVMRCAFGALSLVPCWVALMALRSANYEQNNYFGAWLVVGALLIVWAADIGAFFAGRKFGQRKLAVRVSPNKSIEGLAGGLVLVSILAVVASQFDSVRAALNHVDTVTIVAMAFVVALISAVGDLAESMFKRQANVKDSGTLLPGHGGILDRIDSLLAAMPIFVLFYCYVLAK